MNYKQNHVAEILKNTLSEEKEMDVTLTILAADKINEKAAQEPVEEQLI